MTREWVILSEAPIGDEAWRDVLAAELLQGRTVSWFSGLTQGVDFLGDHVVSWWPSRRVERDLPAAEILASAEVVPYGTWWTDVTAPERESEPRAETIARAVARAVSGRFVEKV